MKMFVLMNKSKRELPIDPGDTKNLSVFRFALKIVRNPTFQGILSLPVVLKFCDRFKCSC